MFRSSKDDTKCYASVEHFELTHHLQEPLLSGLGLSPDKARRAGDVLLDGALVCELVGASATDATKGEALYGLIHWLIGKGLSEHTNFDALVSYLSLTNAYNVDPTKNWPGDDCRLFPGSKEQPTIGWKSANARRDNPRDPIGLDNAEVLAKVASIDNSGNRYWERAAWGEIVSYLLDGGVELSNHLRGWASQYPEEQAKLAQHDLPRVVESFCGREYELTEVNALLGQNRPVLLSGTGGVGKTQIAARVIQDFRSKGVEHIRFIRSGASPDEQLALFGRDLGVTKNATTLSEEVTLTKSYLLNCDEPWLLVFDDLDDQSGPEVYARLVPEGSKQGSIVLTSRVRNLIPSVETVPVDPLQRHDSAELLRGLAGRPEDLDAEELSEKLSDVPLALAQAGAYCVEKVSFRQYIDLLDSVTAIKLTAEPGNSDHLETLYLVWQLSMSAACKVIRISIDVFLSAAHLDGGHIDDAMLDGRRIPEQDRIQALRALSRFSLIDRYDGYFTVHALLQRIAREHAVANFPRENQLHCSSIAFDALLNPALKDSNSTENWPVFERLLPHFLRWGETTPKPSPDERITLILDRLVLCFLGYLTQRQHPYGRDTSSKMIEILERCLGSEMSSDRGKVLLLHAQLGATNISIDVLSEAENGLRLAESSYEVGSVQLWDARFNCANIFALRGQITDAAVLYEGLEEELPDELKESLLHALLLSNLAVAYGHLEMIDEAQECNSLAQSISSMHGQTVQALHIQSLHSPEEVQELSLRDDTTRTQDASTLKLDDARTRLAIVLEELGEDHPAALVRLLDLAMGIFEEGDDDEEALEILEYVVERSESLFGQNDMRTLRAEISFATVLSWTGWVEDAQEILLSVIDRFENAHGELDDQVWDAKVALAISYGNTRPMTKQAVSRVWDIWEEAIKALSPASPWLLDLSSASARALREWKADAIEDAVGILDEAISTYLECGGEEIDEPLRRAVEAREQLIGDR